MSVTETFPVPFGRYQLVERLAVGGMAELFKADVSGAHGFTKTVVIKRILPYLAPDEHYNQMFIDEAKITARLSHPKIAQTLELGKFNGQLYIAMEYIDGLDVLAMLRECAHRRTKLPLATAVHLMQEVLDALDFAHQQTDSDGKPLNIVHRDISPSNILVSRRGDVKLVDFGIAQANEREQETQSGTLKGKYGYMAPEQVIGGGLDHRSDLFSAGIVLAEMAMGRRLFTSPNDLDVLLMVRDVRLDRLGKYGKDLDPDLDQLLRKALSKSRDDRFQTGAEFRDALGEWLFERRVRMGANDMAQLVESLYDDAWKRKRATPIKPPPAPAAAPAAELAAAAASPAGVVGSPDAAHAVTDAGPSPAPPPDPAEPEVESLDALLAEPELELEPERQFPTSASMEEAIALVAGEQDGIPIGLEAPDAEQSMPVVLVEQPSSSRNRAVRALSEDDGDIPIFEGQSADVTAKDEDYDLGDLGAELDLGPGSAVEPAEEGELASSSTTQEFAFDDIVAAVESSIPKDMSGKAIQPSPQALDQARAVQPTVTDVEGEPDDSGELADTSPLKVLFRLTAARASGLLVVRIGGIKKEIYIEDGRPTFVSSNVRSELFGEYLVAQNALSEGELSMALAMMPHYGGKLGDTLVGLGLMKPLDVFRHLTRQVRDKLIDVCTWGKGRFQWYDSRRNEREAFPLDLDSYEVLGAGAMALPEEPVKKWIDGVAETPYKSAKGSVGPDVFQLGGMSRDVYNALDGRHTVAELAARYTIEADRARFCRVLYLLAMTELAHPVQ